MRKYFVFGVAGCSVFIASVAATSVAVAFPVMVDDLNSSLVVAGWVLSSYQLSSICAMLIVSRLSEYYGCKYILMFSIILFTLGSVLCAVAPSAGWLIFARLVQGCGGGSFMPAASGIIADYFRDSRQQAIGLFSGLNPLGAIIGPNIGGWMVSALGWRSVFWINVPLGIAQLVLAMWLIRADRKKSTPNIDFMGAGLLVTGVTSFMVGLSLLDVEGRPLWGPVVGSTLACLVILFLLFKRERKHPNPIVDLGLLLQRPFRETNLYNFVLGTCAFGIFPLIPLYATSVYGMSTMASGLILTPRSVAQLVMATATSLMIMRWGYRRPIVTGTLFLVVTLFVLSLELDGLSVFGLDISPTWLMLGLMLGTGLGMGMSIPAANNACIELMPDRVATIVGIRGTCRQLGGAIFINISMLVLQLVGDIPRAFSMILIVQSLILIITLPAVFIMPSSPRAETASRV